LPPAALNSVLFSVLLLSVSAALNIGTTLVATAATTGLTLRALAALVIPVLAMATASVASMILRMMLLLLWCDRFLPVATANGGKQKPSNKYTG
jgi:hypothetical protein